MGSLYYSKEREDDEDFMSIVAELIYKINEWLEENDD